MQGFPLSVRPVTAAAVCLSLIEEASKLHIGSTAPPRVIDSLANHPCRFRWGGNRIRGPIIRRWKILESLVFSLPLAAGHPGQGMSDSIAPILLHANTDQQLSSLWIICQPVEKDGTYDRIEKIKIYIIRGQARRISRSSFHPGVKLPKAINFFWYFLILICQRWESENQGNQTWIEYLSSPLQKQKVQIWYFWYSQVLSPHPWLIPGNLPDSTAFD